MRAPWPLLFPFALACSSPTESVTAPERGRAAFHDGSASVTGAACATCHFLESSGDPERIYPGGSLYGASERSSFWGEQEDDLLGAVDACRTLFQGLPELVPTSPEAADLYAFLETLAGPADPLPFTVVRDIRDLSAGDPEIGTSIYDRACRHCHGALHDGAGRLRDVIPVLPDDPLARHASYTEEEQRLLFVEKVRHGRFFGYGGYMAPFALEPLPDQALADLLSALELYP